MDRISGFSSWGTKMPPEEERCGRREGGGLECAPVSVLSPGLEAIREVDVSTTVVVRSLL